MPGKVRSFDATLDQLYAMLQFVGEEAKAWGLDSKQLMRLELAAEEALINVISYAYSEPGGELEIEIEKDAHHLNIKLTDGGPAFNPLENKAVHQDLPIEERRIGGWGIPLLLKLVHHVDYCREQNKNILLIEIRKEALS